MDVLSTGRALGPFEYRFTPSPEFIRLARHALADWLREQPCIDPDGFHDLVVACSELCTNAVAHATPSPRSVALRAAVHGDAIRLEVEDDGPGMPAPHDDHDADAESEQGRGLAIVRRVTDRLDVRRVGDRTVVRCEKEAVLAEPLADHE